MITRKLPLLAAILTAALFTCEKVPDYCSKKVSYDPSCQFCFGGEAYNMCGGREYNPLTQGCMQGVDVGTRCLDESTVPAGTPCGGYTLTIDAVPIEGGGVDRSPQDRTVFKYGEDVILNAKPANADYAFAGWAGALTSKEAMTTYSMKGGNPNITIAAMFKPAGKGKLIAEPFPKEGGTITVSPNRDIYSDEYATVTATPAPDYEFIGWSGADTSQSRETQVFIDDSKTLVAVFAPVARTLSVSANPSDAGAVFVNGTALFGTASRNLGTRFDVMAVAERGYSFQNWSGTAAFDDPDNANTTVTLDSNATMTIIANFQRDGVGTQTPPTVTPPVVTPPVVTPPINITYAVTVNSAGTGAGGSGSYAAGAAVTISAGTAPDGQRFKNWTVAGGGASLADASNSTTTFTMPANAVTVTAVFETQTETTPKTDITAEFKDAAFRAEVYEMIGKSAPAPISVSDVSGITYVNVYEKGISDLSGIEYFTALTVLNCDRNKLTALNVSKNTALTYLYCYSNKLTALDVSNNTALTVLECNNNELTVLDVSKNIALWRLDCFGNELTALDMSKNTALMVLHCASNQLTALNVSKNAALTALECNNNQLTALDVSNNTALERLRCESNRLTALDISKNTALKELYCYNNQLTALNVSKNTALTRLDVSWNYFTNASDVIGLDRLNLTAFVFYPQNTR
ncbi:hypothetical protein R80B4_00757 [Fibrobacteres bacterium R8-0-B4]